MAEMTRVVHPFLPAFTQESRVLILGTAPSVKSREMGYYYGHPQNRFWKVLAAVFAEEAVPKSVAEKQSFLQRNGIALYDVVYACDILGSSDASIRNVIPADLGQILAQTGQIPIFANGKTAEALYQKHQFGQTGIPIVGLPSTSPANAAWSLERLVAAWEVVRIGIEKT